MNGEERIQYLANIVKVVHADGQLSPNEDQVLERVRTEIGAKKSELTRARKSIDDTDPSLSELSRWSDRIRNIEDMIECAFADGELQEAERRIIAKLAKVTGVSQEQVNALVREARARLRETSQACACGRQEIDPQARFCPSCGAQLDASSPSQSKAVELQPRSRGITIAFAQSTAASFGEAIRIAKSISSFQQIERKGKTWYAVSVDHSEVESIVELAASLSPMRNKEVYVDGQAADWGSTLDFATCAQQRRSAYNQTEYCFGLEDDQFNPWGCKQMNLPWHAWNELFCHGTFKNESTFAFDKRRIAHELEKHASGVHLCPHFRRKFVQALLDVWPTKVKVGPKTGWKYKEAWGPDPRAISIRLREKMDGMEFTRDINAIGVAPADSNTALDMMAAALKKCREPEAEKVMLRLR